MHQITDNVWISSYRSAKKHQVLKDCGVTAVLVVADEVSFDGPDFCVVKKYGLKDSAQNDPKDVEDAIIALGQLVKGKHQVLVHCLAGISRSVFIVTCYLYAVGFKPPTAGGIVIAQTVHTDIINHPIFDIYLYVKNRRECKEVSTGIWSLFPKINFSRIQKSLALSD